MQTVANTNVLSLGLTEESAPKPRRRRVLRRMVVALRRWVRAVRYRRLEKQTYRALMELDDWQLRDIGLSRSDLMAVARGTFQGRR